jgi:acetoin utilization deacetylase AcuC-like enzyme
VWGFHNDIALSPTRQDPEKRLILYFTDHFELPLPPGHRFPMAKYRLLRDRVLADPVHHSDVLLIPPAASVEQLCLAHDPGYVQRVMGGELTESEIKRIGFPWSPEMVERSRRSSGATLAAARSALKQGVAVNMAGGTHHAMQDCGEGFCVFNDAAVTIKTLLAEEEIQRALVVDCDVHQGNGTAEILGRDTRVFTFSIHGEKNFPLRKHPSSLDVDLPDGVQDEYYLKMLDHGLTQAFAEGPYHLIIYLAGADPYHDDRLGRLKLTKQGLALRDERVLHSAFELGVPVAVAMAGGYARQIEDIVDIHAATLRIASSYAGKWSIRTASSQEDSLRA